LRDGEEPGNRQQVRELVSKGRNRGTEEPGNRGIGELRNRGIDSKADGAKEMQEIDPVGI